MLETITKKLHRNILTIVGAALPLFSACGDTIINNFYGSDAQQYQEDTKSTSFSEVTRFIPDAQLSDTPSAKPSCISDLEDNILESETKYYPFENKTYEITLSYVDNEKSKFIIDGTSTDSIKKGESYTLKDGATICIKDTFYQPYPGGVHAATFTFSAGKDAGKINSKDTTSSSDIFSPDASSAKDTSEPDTTTTTSKINDQYTCGEFSWYPNKFLKKDTNELMAFNGYFVVGEKAAAIDNITMTDIATNLWYEECTTTNNGTQCLGQTSPAKVYDATKLDSEIADISAQNIITIGTPCINSVTAELLGNPTDCVASFTPGQAKIILLKHKETKNLAMIVAGYSGQDTRLAGKVLAHRWKEIQNMKSGGCEIIVEGTTWSDAVISKKTP